MCDFEQYGNVKGADAVGMSKPMTAWTLGPMWLPCGVGGWQHSLNDRLQWLIGGGLGFARGHKLGFLTTTAGIISVGAR